MARLTYKAKSFQLTFFLKFLFYIVKIFLSIVEDIIDSVNSLGLWNKIFSLYSHFKGAQKLLILSLAAPLSNIHGRKFFKCNSSA